MNILIIMVPISLALGLGFLLSFVWSVKSGQLDDTETPAHRILED
ncbi:MAG: cbb3-type cytochrome oxidase assembly protein CcoS [Bdellovibrionales bacterium]